MFNRERVHGALHSLCCDDHDCSYCVLAHGHNRTCLLIECVDGKASYAEAIRVALSNKNKLNDDKYALSVIMKYGGAMMK